MMMMLYSENKPLGLEMFVKISKPHWLLVTVILTNGLVMATEIENCCRLNQLTEECSDACHEIALSQSGNYHVLHLSCPPSLVKFWSCVQPLLTGPARSPSSSQASSSLPSSSSSEWWGRSCCELSLTSLCKNACLKAKSDHEMETHCSRADGAAVYKCLDKHREGQKCCQSSSTDQCHSSCKALFIQDTPPDQSQIQAAIGQCNAPVVECIIKRFPSRPSNLPPHNIECCDHGFNQSCSKECRKVLSSDSSEEQMVESLAKSCGIPNPTDPMWQCFLRKSTGDSKNRGNSGGTVAVGGMDVVKLQCCQRAVKTKCRSLCEMTFNTGWSETISEFHQHCTNNLQEMSLNACLEDAEDRCQVGCSDLTYCSNFNYRPTELFRKCTRGADVEARKTFHSWKDGFISLPDILKFDIPVKDITKCYPEKWQVIVCVLHVKPCRSRGGSWICKRDCLDILSSCLDRKRMASPLTIVDMCDLLSPTDDPDECISVDSYLTEGHHKTNHQEVSTPCNPNPCKLKEVCLVVRQPCQPIKNIRNSHRGKANYYVYNNRNAETDNRANLHYSSSIYLLNNDDAAAADEYDDICPAYMCRPGCPMGEMVTQLVIPGSLVRLQDPTNPSCFSLCRCGYYGNWDNCTKTCNEDGHQQRQCPLSSGMIHEHGAVFIIGCNTCVCSNRETVCTLKYCRILPFQPSPPYVTYVVHSTLVVAGLPCNCSALYRPFCASTGQTFPNQCLAKCHKFEMFQLQTGSCQSIDPCINKPCGPGERCIKTPQICLGGPLLPQSLCPQYQCIKTSSCGHKSSHSWSTSYCDVTTSSAYNSLCEAVMVNSTSVCDKHCSSDCKRHGRVCGVDEVTYQSECMARCNNVPVDYYSPCSTIAQHYNVTSKTTCARVNCPLRTFSKGCNPVVPPGACCPICAGEIRCLVSQRQALAMSHQHGAISISGLVKILESLLSVKECRVYAYFSIEAELVLLITPNIKSPSSVQVEACMREAGHLAGLISTRSPVIISYARTSVLLTAELKHSKKTSMFYSSSSSSSSSCLLLFTFFMMMMMMMMMMTITVMTMLS